MDETFKINPNRKKILDRYQGRITSQEEFNFDMLTAPPLYQLFNNQDIWDIYEISSSLRLSGKPKIKKDKINAIMCSRGFDKVSAGTNRVTYKFAGDNSFLAKIAYDSVGRQADIDEFKNQAVFKPYVAKVFEVDPTGTVQICERVEACTSKVSYDSIRPYADILRRKWFFGEYVWSDIGDDAWMNWGVRYNFGPVLLDYPTCVKLDPNKTRCACGGDIALDEGFNRLICLKCGTEFLISEVQQDIDENLIVIEERGTKKMTSRFITNRSPEWNKQGMTQRPETKITSEVNPPAMYGYGTNNAIPHGYEDRPTGKFIVTTGKVKHNTNPKVKIPRQDDKPKHMDRGYVKDNNRTNNNGNKNNNQKKYDKRDDNRVALDKYNSVVEELNLAKKELFEHEEALAKYKASYEELKKENETTVKDLLKQIDDLNNTQINELQFEEKENIEITHDRQELLDKISALESKLTVADEVTKTVKANLDSRDNAYAKLLKENETLKSQTQKITENEVVVDRAEYNGLLSSIDDMTNTIESMTLESSSLKGELNDSKHLIDRLNEKISGLEESILDVNKKDERLALLQSEKEQLEDDYRALKQEKDELAKQLEEAEPIAHGDDEYISSEDYNIMTRVPNLYSMSAKISEIKDLIEGSEDDTKILVLYFPSSDEVVYDPDGKPYVVTEIGGISVNELTMIKTEALEKLSKLAEERQVKDDRVSK